MSFWKKLFGITEPTPPHADREPSQRERSRAAFHAKRFKRALDQCDPENQAKLAELTGWHNYYAALATATALKPE